MALIDKLTAIADAIRGKTGKTDGMTLDQMVTEIEGIQTGGGGSSAEFETLVSIIADTEQDIYSESITVIGQNSLRYCSAASISMPNLKEIKMWGLANCGNLTSVNFPTLKTATTGSLGNNVKLEEIVLASLETAFSQMFSGCTGLKKIDLPIAKEIHNGAFRNGSALTTLILRKTDAVCVLRDVAAFGGTPFASGGTGGTVYCPASLISQYQTATNWSTLYAAGSMTFVAIEGSEYE